MPPPQLCCPLRHHCRDILSPPPQASEATAAVFGRRPTPAHAAATAMPPMPPPLSRHTVAAVHERTPPSPQAAEAAAAVIGRRLPPAHAAATAVPPTPSPPSKHTVAAVHVREPPSPRASACARLRHSRAAHATTTAKAYRPHRTHLRTSVVASCRGRHPCRSNCQSITNTPRMPPTG